MEEILQKVKTVLNKYNIINKKIIIAFSGGKDSSVLLSILHKLSNEYKLTLSLAYVNHNLRTDSDLEEEFVSKIARKYNLKLYKKKVKKEFWNVVKKDSIEMAARKIRYSFFYLLLKKTNYDYIVTAHNFNDKIETFFLKLFRGGDIDSLKGIPLKNKRVIRPLLFVTREEIENYITKNNIEFYEDYTNKESIYKRNIIRNELFPVFKKINKDFTISFSYVFKNLHEIHDFLKLYIKKVLKKVVLYYNDNLFVLHKEIFEKLPSFLKKRVIKTILNRLSALSILNNKLLNNIAENKMPSKYYKKNFFYIEKTNYLWLFNKKYLNNDITISIEYFPFSCSINKKNIYFYEINNKIIDMKNTFVFSINTSDLPLHIRRLNKEKDYLYISYDKEKKISKILEDLKIPKILHENCLLLTTNKEEIIGFIFEFIYYRVSYKFYYTSEKNSDKKNIIIKM